MDDETPQCGAAAARSKQGVGAELVERFAEQGFVRVDDLLASAELARFQSAVDAAVAARTRFDSRTLQEKSRYEQSFQQCLNLWEDHAGVRPLTFHPKLARVAALLLGVDAVRVWHDQALYKEPGGRATDPHQDQPYWTIAEPRTVTAWIPFQDVDEANGQMGFLPGSHRTGAVEFADIFTGRGLDLERHELYKDVEIDWLPVSRGAVSFHHGLTVHCARPNATAEVRRVHTVIFFADGCTRSAHGRHPSVDRAGIAPGERIESPVTPLAWPAPAALPEPPPPPERRLPGWPGWGGAKDSPGAGRR